MAFPISYIKQGRSTGPRNPASTSTCAFSRLTSYFHKNKGMQLLTHCTSASASTASCMWNQRAVYQGDSPVHRARGPDRFPLSIHHTGTGVAGTKPPFPSCTTSSVTVPSSTQLPCSCPSKAEAALSRGTSAPQEGQGPQAVLRKLGSPCGSRQRQGGQAGATGTALAPARGA